MSLVSFLHPLKTLETQMLSSVPKGYRKRPMTWVKGVEKSISIWLEQQNSVPKLPPVSLGGIN